MYQICWKIWILSEPFVKSVFIAKCNKKNSNTLFRSFWKKLLQLVTNRESFPNFKFSQLVNYWLKTGQLLQSVAKIYFKSWQVLQSETNFFYAVRRNTLQKQYIHFISIHTTQYLHLKVKLRTKFCFSHSVS